MHNKVLIFSQSLYVLVKFVGPIVLENQGDQTLSGLLLHGVNKGSRLHAPVAITLLSFEVFQTMFLFPCRDALIKDQSIRSALLLVELNQSSNSDYFFPQPIQFPTDLINTTAVEVLVRQIHHEINLKKQWLDVVIFIAKVLLSFAFVLVFIR